MKLLGPQSFLIFLAAAAKGVEAFSLRPTVSSRSSPASALFYHYEREGDRENGSRNGWNERYERRGDEYVTQDYYRANYNDPYAPGSYRESSGRQHYPPATDGYYGSSSTNRDDYYYNPVSNYPDDDYQNDYRNDDYGRSGSRDRNMYDSRPPLAESRRNEDGRMVPNDRRSRNDSWNNNNNDNGMRSFGDPYMDGYSRDPSSSMLSRSPFSLFQEMDDLMDRMMMRPFGRRGSLLGESLLGGSSLLGGNLFRSMADDIAAMSREMDRMMPAQQLSVPEILDQAQKYLEEDPACRDALGEDIELDPRPFAQSQSSAVAVVNGQQQVQRQMQLRTRVLGSRGDGVVEIFSSGNGITEMTLSVSDGRGGEARRIPVLVDNDPPRDDRRRDDPPDNLPALPGRSGTIDAEIVEA